MWQGYQLGHMQICTLPQTDNHASILPLSFFGWAADLYIIYIYSVAMMFQHVTFADFH